MSNIKLEKIEALTNDKCNSQCVGQLSCSQMWSVMQYRSYEALSSGYGGYGVPYPTKTMRFDDKPLSRIKKIASSYAKIYLETTGAYDKPNLRGRFYWMGLGAFAAKQVYCAILALNDKANQLGAITPSIDFTRDDIVFLRKNMLKGNLWLFLDIYPSHIYYKSNPQDFLRCHDSRNATGYSSNVYKALKTIPYNSALSQINNFSPSTYIKKAFEHIAEFERTGDLDIRLESLLRVADHEQRAVLQKCFYEPDQQTNQRIKKIFDAQKTMAINHPNLMQLARVFADIQGRQAVLTNACRVTILTSQYMSGVKKEHYEKFYEDMLDNEDLYDENMRMKFITRIANDYDFIMRTYREKAEGYIADIAKGNINTGELF